MGEKLETNSLGENQIYRKEIEEIIKSCEDKNLIEYTQLNLYFQKKEILSFENIQIINLVKQINKKSFQNVLINFLKFKRSKEILNELNSFGDIVLAKSFLRSLLLYCDQKKLLSHASDLLENYGMSLLGRRETRSKNYQIEFERGNFKISLDDLDKTFLSQILKPCFRKKVFSLDSEVILKIINSDSSVELVRTGSNRDIKSLLLIIGRALVEGKITNESLSEVREIINSIDSTFINIKSRNVSLEKRKSEQIKELINKSKVLSNLKRVDMLENILFELKAIDENNAWLQYLEHNTSFIGISNKEREKIFSYYDNLIEHNFENLKTKSIEKEIKEYLKEAAFEEFSDLFFMSYSLGITSLSLYIAEKIISECKTNDDLVNGLVLKIKSLMAMKEWLSANNVIDEVLEEIPVKASEKRTLLSLKIKCLDSLNLNKEASFSRKTLRGLEQVD